MQFPLTLTENNVRNLVKGRPAGLKKEQLMGDSHLHHVRVHPLTHQKLTIAKAKGRGMRLTMNPQEVEETIAGEGFGDIWRKIKSGAQKVASVAKAVVSSEPYQTLVKPIVRRAVQTGVAAVTPALSSVVSPETIQKGVDYVGKETGAFGLKPPSKGGRKKKMVGGSFVIA